MYNADFEEITWWLLISRLNLQNISLFYNTSIIEFEYFALHQNSGRLYPHMTINLPLLSET